MRQATCTSRTSIGLIRLTSRNDVAFEVGKLETDGFKGMATDQDCVPAKASCKLVKLVIADDQPLGSIKGKLWVDLPQFHQRLPIAVWGVAWDCVTDAVGSGAGGAIGSAVSGSMTSTAFV